MIKLPDISRSFEYENGFALTGDKSRLGKMLAHYELFKATLDIPGAIVECGVFKGNSLVNLARMRSLFSSAAAKKIVGFDIFGEFPDTGISEDQELREAFVAEAGTESIDPSQLETVLDGLGLGANVELIAGDISQTVPAYVQAHPEMKIALLHLDVDLYEPSVAVLEHLWPMVSRGGIMMLDDYGTFFGETRAVDEFFADHDVEIRKLPWVANPSYIVKP